MLCKSCTYISDVPGTRTDFVFIVTPSYHPYMSFTRITVCVNEAVHIPVKSSMVCPDRRELTSMVRKCGCLRTQTIRASHGDQHIYDTPCLDNIIKFGEHTVSCLACPCRSRLRNCAVHRAVRMIDVQ